MIQNSVICNEQAELLLTAAARLHAEGCDAVSCVMCAACHELSHESCAGTRSMLLAAAGLGC